MSLLSKPQGHILEGPAFAFVVLIYQNTPLECPKDKINRVRVYLFLQIGELDVLEEGVFVLAQARHSRYPTVVCEARMNL